MPPTVHNDTHSSDGDFEEKFLAPELDPHNWSRGKKWINLLLIASQATLPPICSTLLAVGAREVEDDLHITLSAISGLTVAVFVLGLGLGPLFLAPLSEMYGRRIVYILSFSIFCVLNIGCALVKHTVGLIALRFLAGLAGSAGSSLGGGSIGDMFKREERGGAQAMYSFGPTFGPVIGGIIGGYIAQRAGWRWLMWVVAIGSGVTVILSILFLHETYAPYIHARNQGKRSAEPTIDILHSITRPLRMLFFAPIATAMSLYVSLVYGILYLHLTTTPLLFGPQSYFGLFTYKWENGNEGLAYLGAGFGCFTSIIFCLFTLNRSYRSLCAKYGEHRPEFRMPFMQAGMILLPAGLFTYGWSAEAQTHWIVPLIGAAILAFGMLLSYICVQTYLVDTFGNYAASALAATIVLRSVFGAIFSIVGVELYHKLGYGWGTSVIAFVAIAALPIPYIFWRFGERLRAKPFIV